MLFFQKIFMKIIKMNNWFLFLTTLVLILFSSYFIVFLEPESFPTAFDGLWWVMTTVTTVGYGDYYPVSKSGRIFAIFLYLFGIGLIGVVIGKIVDWFSNFRIKREEGKVVYKGKDHIVIIGWSQKAKYAIEEILKTENMIDIVIIDQLEKAPILEDNIVFIHGNASERKTLEHANLSNAKAVLIFADDSIHNSELTDGKSLLIASSIESFSPNIHTTVEIMKEEHISNFRHVHVDEFVLTNEMVSRLAVRSTFTKGISAVFSQLMSRQFGDDLRQIKKDPSWVTYHDAFNALLKEGATLVADRDRLNINRHLNETIPDDALLYIICDNNTYTKLTINDSEMVDRKSIE